jgi:protein-L-isoaspartate O-methyltransferase
MPAAPVKPLTPYDVVPYPSEQHTDLHPAAVGAMAALCGIPTPCQSYRALEVGCGEGVNLMAMAEAAPESEFIGVDLAPSAIETARAVAKAARLQNVRFEVVDLARIGESFGRFDYMIAHGVLAWVPASVREALMRLFGEALTPNGMAVVSYNVTPGCGLRQVIREALRPFLAHERIPERRLALARLRLAELAELWNVDDPFRQALRKEAVAQLAKPAAVLFHDELGEIYAPQRFETVVGVAAKAGLVYVCDAQQAWLASTFEKAADDDLVSAEQQSDIVQMTRFRRSVFAPIGAPVSWRDAPERWSGLWLHGEIDRLPPEAGGRAHRFSIGRGGEVELDDDETAQALDRLSHARMAAVPYDDLASICGHRTIAKLVSGGALRLRARRPAVAERLPTRPRVGALARALAMRGATNVPTRGVGSLKLGDDAARALFLSCDGTRDHEELADEMTRRLNVPRGEAGKGVATLLERFQRLGVFAS